ncbi:MAG: hypothetical protein WKF82_12925 [Nocardioidaceae bacterium]
MTVRVVDVPAAGAGGGVDATQQLDQVASLALCVRRSGTLHGRDVADPEVNRIRGTSRRPRCHGGGSGCLGCLQKCRTTQHVRVGEAGTAVSDHSDAGAHVAVASYLSDRAAVETDVFGIAAFDEYLGPVASAAQSFA